MDIANGEGGTTSEYTGANFMVIKFFKILGILFLIVFAIGLMLPAVSRGREGARRAGCKNNLKKIVLALSTYESIYHALPPAHTVDENGNPLHSWRTLLLPYLGHQKLYETIDLSKPWDDPANTVARKKCVEEFYCQSTIYLPNGAEWKPENNTTYLAVVASDSCFRSIEPRRRSDMSNGRGETIMLIEVAKEYATHWMDPVDADEQMVLKSVTNPNCAHAKGTHAAMVDGTVRFLSVDMPEDKIRALISISGNKTGSGFW